MSRRTDTEADLGEVRHAFELNKLEDYICRLQPNNFAAPISIKQFGYGQSNPSYQIIDAKGRKYVLRKQPPGKLLSKSAHRVDREFFMQRALKEHTNVPVASMCLLCEDPAIIGTMFYIMEFLDGRIFHEARIEDVGDDDRRALWGAVISTLAQLHAVDPRKIDLPASMTRNFSSHYPRQIKTMATVIEAQSKAKDPRTDNQLGSVPDVDEILHWMERHMPSERVGIVHGDFKIDNIVFARNENKVIGILDWELCTIGHPLADLGNLLQPYSIPQTSKLPVPPSFRMNECPGLPTLEQQLVNYYNYSGYDPRPDFKFAIVYAHMRLTMITHGIAARALQGQASSAEAAKVGQLYHIFAALATTEIERRDASSSKL